MQCKLNFVLASDLRSPFQTCCDGLPLSSTTTTATRRVWRCYTGLVALNVINQGISQFVDPQRRRHWERSHRLASIRLIHRELAVLPSLHHLESLASKKTTAILEGRERSTLPPLSHPHYNDALISRQLGITARPRNTTIYSRFARPVQLTSPYRTLIAKQGKIRPNRVARQPCDKETHMLTTYRYPKALRHRKSSQR